MFCYPEEYQLGIRKMNREDIIEIDNLNELMQMDPGYQNYEMGERYHEEGKDKEYNKLIG